MNIKIGTKITFLAVLAVVALLFCVWTGYKGISDLNNLFTFCMSVPVKNVHVANKMATNLKEITACNARYFLYRDNTKKLKELSDRIAYLTAKNTELLEFLKTNVPPESTEYIKLYEDRLAISKPPRLEMQKLVSEGKMDEAAAIRTGEYQEKVDSTIAAIYHFIDFSEKRLEFWVHDIGVEEANHANFLLFLEGGLTILILIVLSSIIRTGIVKPLRQAVEAADRVADGDLNINISTNSNDEIGMLMRSFKVMIRNINRLLKDTNNLINQATEGELDARADATHYKGDYRELVEEMNRLIDTFVEPLKVASVFLKGISEGSKDLKLVTANYKGDFTILKDAINTTYDTIFTILGEITNIAEASKDGNLDIRADSSKVKGTWVEIMNGINGIVDSASSIINDAGEVISVMATGDLTVRMDHKYSGKFETMKEDINNLGDSLTDLVCQLQVAIHTTALASSQIAATSEMLASSIQAQKLQTDEVASAMEEMSRTVAENAHSATKTATVAKESSDKANEGGKIVNQTITKMKEIAEVVKASANNMGELGENSKKISEITEVINNIADQTNLLSLNAAIEAARVGELGRGFAVVADSVGKLAISTSSATKEIGAMVKTIQQDTENAVLSMEKGTAEVKTGIELADKAGTSLDDILSGINELLDMVNQIAVASEQQSVTSDNIAKSVTKISHVTTDSTRNIEDVATTVTALARMTDNLTSLVSQFKVNYSNNHSNSNSLDSDSINNNNKSDRYLE